MKQNISSRYVIICLYIIGYTKILECFIFPSVVSLINYFLFSILFIKTLSLNRFHMSKKFVTFYCFYALSIFINASVVSYYKYVLIEGLTSILISINTIYIINSKYFDFNNFLKTWRTSAKYTTLSLFFLLIIFKMGWVNYGIFAWITVPNVLILTWDYVKLKCYLNITMLLLVINVTVTILFGGRMAAFVEIFVVAYAFVAYKKISTKKIFVIGIGIGISILFLFNMESILTNIGNILVSKGYKSRTLALIIEELKTENIFENIYLSGRENIYALALDYIINRFGLPGGFGVIRHLTKGKYYMAHNLILELLITIGFWGTLLFFICTILRLNIMRKRENKNYIQFVALLIVFYVIYSFTGQSLFNSPIAILTTALLFFYDNKLVYNNKF